MLTVAETRFIGDRPPERLLPLDGPRYDPELRASLLRPRLAPGARRAGLNRPKAGDSRFQSARDCLPSRRVRSRVTSEPTRLAQEGPAPKAFEPRPSFLPKRYWFRRLEGSFYYSEEPPHLSLFASAVETPLMPRSSSSRTRQTPGPEK